MPGSWLRGAFRDGFSPCSWQSCFPGCSLQVFQKAIQIAVRVDGGRVILHQPTSVRRGTIIAVEIACEHAQHGHLLAAVVRGVCDAPRHHPSH